MSDGFATFAAMLGLTRVVRVLPKESGQGRSQLAAKMGDLP